MRPLPLKLRKNGSDYTQLLREGRLCIYERMVVEDLKYYEVFIVQVKPERSLFGKDYSACEVFPRNEDFGKTAWCCQNFEQALYRFNGLMEKEAKKTRCL